MTRRYQAELTDSGYSALFKAALNFPVGMVVWSVPMVLSAHFKAFHTELLGILGWILTAIFIVRGQIPEIRPVIAKIKKNPWNLALGVFLLFVAFLYTCFPSDCIRGGIDMGTYTNHGLYIARHGRLDIEYPYPKELAPLFDPARVDQKMTYAGFYPTSNGWTSQFPHFYPVWLAQAYGSFGYWGLQRLNGFLALLALTLFFGFCLRIVAFPYALAAALFLALNPSQLWTARVTLTEIPAQLFILAGITLHYVALKFSRKGLARWAGVVYGGAALIRIDAFFLLPLLFLAHLVSRIFDSPDQKNVSPIWRSLYLTALPVFLVALLYYAFFNSVYFLSLSENLKLIGIACLGALSLLLISSKGILSLIKTLVHNRYFQFIFGTAIFSLAGYVYWIRPLAKNPAVFNFPLSALHGTRTYEEYSLVNLGTYLTPLIIWGAIFGILYLLFSQKERGVYKGAFPFLVIFCGFSFLYLWKPYIDSAHFWAIRRFVPIIIPGFILCASVAFYRIFQTLKLRLSRILAVSLGVILVIFSIRAAGFMLFFPENQGYFSQLKKLSRILPEEDLILAYDPFNDSAWTTPLYFALDKKVVPIDVNSDIGMKTMSSWISRQINLGKSAHLLYEGLSLSLPQAVRIGTEDLTRSSLVIITPLR
ncbi:hypothetical protein ACFLT9_06740 [Acidobacteriota bacterium]